MANKITTKEQYELAQTIYDKEGCYDRTASVLNKKWKTELTGKYLKYKLTRGKVPLSENQVKIKTATREECIEDLRALAEKNPDLYLSRNFYRVHSKYSESAWNQHFGTFNQFRRDAGITLSRHAGRLELNIAKHSSLEAYNEMNDEKRHWGEAYLKPCNKRYQTMLVCSDVHDIEADPFWVYLFLRTVKRVQPEKVILNGDIFDLPEFSKYQVDPRDWNVVARIEWVHRFLQDIRNASCDSEIIFVEGNHEFRLLRHLSEATPAVQVILSDLHGWTVPKLLGLDEFEVNYIAPADLGTLTKSDIKAELRKNYYVAYDAFLACHFPEARHKGLPGCNGHHHKHLVWAMNNRTYGAYEWHQYGSGHKQEAGYCDGSKWAMGFGVVHVDTHKNTVQQEYIDTTSDHCVIGGTWYERTDVPIS